MRDTPDAVMLFAAGFGARMKHLTKDTPKPMLRVAGRPLIDHALEISEAVRPRVTVANLHYLPEMLVDHLEPKGVKTLVEQPDILDTGGGLRNALPLLGDGPVFALNTDAVWRGPNPMQMLKSAWRPDQMDALLMCIPMARVHGRTAGGDFNMDADGRLHRKGDYVYGGAQIIKTGLLETFSEAAFSLNLLWNKMDQAGRLFGTEYPGHWCDVGHPEGIQIAETLLERQDV